MLSGSVCKSEHRGLAFHESGMLFVFKQLRFTLTFTHSVRDSAIRGDGSNSYREAVFLC